MASLITRMSSRASSSLLRPSFVAFSGKQRRFFSEGSSYDIFQKIQDPPTDGASDKRRKPSDKVVRLVDEIMNLTLIEAADLCDLCQEKLAERSGGPDFRGQAAAGRTPFPHPSAMFAASNIGMMAPQMGMPMMGMPMVGGAPVAAAAAPAAPVAAAAVETPASAAPPKEEKKASYNLKLLGFDAAKKVTVIKEVRALTNLGLKESKEMVEGAPKVVFKGIKPEDVDALKAKFEAAGAQVAFE